MTNVRVKIHKFLINFLRTLMTINMHIKVMNIAKKTFEMKANDIKL